MVEWVALAIALASLGWQGYEWWHKRRLHLSIQARTIAQHGEEFVSLTVINDGHHDVRVLDVGWEDPGAETGVLRSFRSVEAKVVAAHDAESWSIDTLSLLDEGFSPRSPTVFWASLSTRERILSAPQVVAGPEASGAPYRKEIDSG